MMVMAMAALSGCGKKTINLNDYVTIKADGYDSMGTATYVFDRSSFLEDSEGKISVKIKNNSDYAFEKAMGADPAEMLLDYCVSYNFKADNNLSNGDVVGFVWTVMRRRLRRTLAWSSSTRTSNTRYRG